MKPHDHGIVNKNDEQMTISRLRRSWSEKDCLIVEFLEYLYGHRGWQIWCTKSEECSMIRVQ